MPVENGANVILEIYVRGVTWPYTPQWPLYNHGLDGREISNHAVSIFLTRSTAQRELIDLLINSNAGAKKNKNAKNQLLLFICRQFVLSYKGCQQSIKWKSHMYQIDALILTAVSPIRMLKSSFSANIKAQILNRIEWNTECHWLSKINISDPMVKE